MNHRHLVKMSVHIFEIFFRSLPFPLPPLCVEVPPWELVKEPPEEDSPLYELAQTHSLLLTPHIGWQRIESRQRLIDSVAENIRSFLAGNPINLCN